MRNVYIQRDNDGQILNHNLFAAFEGFSKKAYDIHYFHILPPTENPDDIVCGSVAAVRQSWRYMGVTLPPMLDYPTELLPFLGRDIWEETLGDIRRNIFSDAPQPRFVKPKNHHKLFTGAVMQTPGCLNETTQHDDEIAVWVSKPIKFITEYRIFVQAGAIRGAKHYYGNYRVLPDFARVEQAIAAYHSAPICYSIDFGVTDQGETLLIEVNDFFALGNYGLDSFVYASMMEARWDEVTGSRYLEQFKN